MTASAPTVGKYRLWRQAGGRGYFAQVEVGISDRGDDQPADVIWAVDSSDQASVQPEADPLEAAAAMEGTRELLAALPSLGISTRGRVVSVRRVLVNLVDSELPAIHAAASAATATAFGAGDRFEIVFDHGWHCRVATP